MNRKISKQSSFKGPWDIRGKQLWNKSINGESTLRIKQASKPPPLKKKKKNNQEKHLLNKSEKELLVKEKLQEVNMLGIGAERRSWRKRVPTACVFFQILFRYWLAFGRTGSSLLQQLLQLLQAGAALQLRFWDFSLRWLLLWSTGSRKRAQWLPCRDLVPLWRVESSQTRNWTHVPCMGRQILNQWTTREVPMFWLLRKWRHSLSVRNVRLQLKIWGKGIILFY